MKKAFILRNTVSFEYSLTTKLRARNSACLQLILREGIWRGRDVFFKVFYILGSLVNHGKAQVRRVYKKGELERMVVNQWDNVF